MVLTRYILVYLILYHNLREISLDDLISTWSENKLWKFFTLYPLSDITGSNIYLSVVPHDIVNPDPISSINKDKSYIGFLSLNRLICMNYISIS